MQYLLKTLFLEEHKSAEISQEVFDALKAARKILNCAFEIEEKWNLVTFNFFELLSEQLKTAARNTLSSQINYEDFYQISTAFSARLANFLGTTRLYLDQAVHSLPKELGLRESFKASQKAHCDASPEYRFMGALRNYMQHRSLPIHQIFQNSKWTSRDKVNAKMEFLTTLYAFKEKLSEDKEFHSRVLAEMPDRVDLIHYAKCYVEHLSAIHSELRDLLKEHVNAAKEKIFAAQAIYQNAGGTCSLDGLTAYHIEGETVIEKISLLMKWEEVREAMVLRNPKLTNFSKTMVVSEEPDRFQQ